MILEGLLLGVALFAIAGGVLLGALALATFLRWLIPGHDK